MSQHTEANLKPFSVVYTEPAPLPTPTLGSPTPTAAESVVVDDSQEEEEKIVAGMSLASYVSKPEMLPSVDWSLALLEQICESFKTFHQNSMFHWQLETNKVHVIEMPKLTEIPEGKEEKKGDAAATTVVLPQEALYVAPEVVAGGVATQRSDVYSLAAVFYEILTNLPVQAACPFPDHAGRFQEYEWLGMQKVLQQAMSKSPEDRYESIEEFWDAILDARRDPAKPPPSKMAKYAGKVQKEMGDHVRQFVNGEAKAKTATWMNGGGGGGSGIGLGSPIVDEVVKVVVKEVFGALMKVGTQKVNGAIDKKIAAAQTQKASWLSRLFQGMKKSMLWIGLVIGMVTAGGVKLITMFKRPAVVAHKPQQVTKKVKEKLPLTLRMWQGIRGMFVSKKTPKPATTLTKTPRKVPTPGTPRKVPVPQAPRDRK